MEDIYKKMKEIRKRQNDERIKQLLLLKQEQSNPENKELAKESLLAIRQYIKDHTFYYKDKKYEVTKTKDLLKFINDQLRGLRR